jgi:hypothetical protein
MITVYCGSVKTSSRPVLLEKATEQVCSAAYPCVAFGCERIAADTKHH